MVAFRRLRKSRIFSVSPVEISAIDNDPTNGRTVTTNPFCSRFDHDVCSMFQGPEQCSAAAKGIVDDQWQIVFLCQFRKFLEIRNIETWVANGFQIDRFGFLVDQLLKTGGIQVIGDTCSDTNVLEGNFELVVGSAIQKGRGDKIVTGAGNVGDGNELCSVSGGNSQCCNPTLKGCNPFLKHIGGRIHQSRIDVPKFLEAKEVGGVFGIFKHVGSCLINWNGP